MAQEGLDARHGGRGADFRRSPGLRKRASAGGGGGSVWATGDAAQSDLMVVITKCFPD